MCEEDSTYINSIMSIAGDMIYGQVRETALTHRAYPFEGTVHHETICVPKLRSSWER